MAKNQKSTLHQRLGRRQNSATSSVALSENDRCTLRRMGYPEMRLGLSNAPSNTRGYSCEQRLYSQVKITVIIGRGRSRCTHFTVDSCCADPQTWVICLSTQVCPPKRRGGREVAERWQSVAFLVGSPGRRRRRQATNITRGGALRCCPK